MTTDDAIQFLSQYQPMPPTIMADARLIDQYAETVELLTEFPDVRSIPLLLNSFGEGDLNGVYPLVEDVLTVFSDDLVVPHLKTSLKSKSISIQYWSAQIAGNFLNVEILPELKLLAKSQDVDVRTAAVLALIDFTDQDLATFITDLLDIERDVNLIELLKGFVTAG